MLPTQHQLSKAQVIHIHQSYPSHHDVPRPIHQLETLYMRCNPHLGEGSNGSERGKPMRKSYKSPFYNFFYLLLSGTSICNLSKSLLSLLSHYLLPLMLSTYQSNLNHCPWHAPHLKCIGLDFLANNCRTYRSVFDVKHLEETHIQIKSNPSIWWLTTSIHLAIRCVPSCLCCHPQVETLIEQCYTSPTLIQTTLQ